MTFPEVGALDRARTLGLLPVGAVEAHGPHLPLGTDGIIARAMAEAAGERLEQRGYRALLLPPLDFTVASFARNFPGTISFRPATVRALLHDLLTGLEPHVAAVGIANAHLDPGHLTALREAFSSAPVRIAFPDLTRRKLAQRLTAEFQSGACHAGCYETSIVLAACPELVGERALAPNPRSLVDAIRAGQSTFEEAGGPAAYFGDPGLASAEEGRQTIRVLGEILAEAVEELLA